MHEVISQTEVFCPACRCAHPARQLLEEGRIIGEVDCPVGPWRTTLSAHSDLFLQFRSQAGFRPDYRAPEDRPFFFHYVPVTNDCNCRCPVCYSDSGTSEDNDYLSLEEAREIAKTALDKGAWIVVLVGGEPTMHPLLAELIRLFSHSGLCVWMATNGLRLAADPALPARLKKAGLEKVSLQLDSFDLQTHRAIRGNDFIPEKIEAARLVAAAGLNLGLVCTVTSHNLAELSSYCRRVFDWPAPPGTIVFQGAAHVGRLAIDGDRHITREEIVSSLVEGQAISGLTNADFWPIPVFRPLHIHVHPDCAANTVAVITDRKVETASGYADMDRFIELASRSPECPRPGSRRRYLLALALKCMGRRGWGLLARHVIRRLSGGSGTRIVFIGTGAFLQRDFQDLSRVQRCGSAALTASGCESLCSFHGKQPCNGA